MGVPCQTSMKINKDTYPEYQALGLIDNPIECGHLAAYPFFLSYTVCVTFVILNLFIAVIFDGFYESQKSEWTEVIQMCVQMWKQYDPNLTMMIPLESSFDFIDEVVCKFIKESEPPGLNTKPTPDPLLGDTPTYMSLDLHYMRMVNLQVTPENEVRFVSVVKAILRRITCQGGIGTLKEDGRAEKQVRRRVEVLDELDLFLRVNRDVKEARKLRDLERFQSKQITASLECRRKKTAAGKPEEVTLLEQVAAGKIQ